MGHQLILVSLFDGMDPSAARMVALCVPRGIVSRYFVS